MSIIKLIIVGLPYSKDLSGQVGKFLAEAEGRAMTIRPESSNDNDKVAIRAYDWVGRFVGYVSKNDLPIAWGALKCSEKTKLRGMVVGACIKHPCVTFECSVKGYKGPATDLYSQKPFLEWKYSGPILELPNEFDDIAYMREEIKDRLDERDDWDREDLEFFIELVNRFARLSKYDISGEMSDYRAELIENLKAADCEEFASLIDELTMTASRTGRETMGGGVLEFWTNQIQSTQTRKHLMVHQREFNAQSVENELELFPDSMYFEWKSAPERFVSKLYYMHIPRQVIWSFVSGIAFVEMNKAIAQKAEAEKAEKQKRNIFFTGDHATYNENPNQ